MNISHGDQKIMVSRICKKKELCENEQFHNLLYIVLSLFFIG